MGLLSIRGIPEHDQGSLALTLGDSASIRAHLLSLSLQGLYRDLPFNKVERSTNFLSTNRLGHLGLSFAHLPFSYFTE